MRLLPNGDADNPANGHDAHEQDSGQNSECSPSSEHRPDIVSSAMAPADLLVAQKLQEMLARESDRIIERKKERTAIEAF